MDTNNDIWILNPDYHFKNDRDRICMYSNRTVNFDSINNWISYIHPIQAMILGLFTNDKPLRLQYESIANHFHITLSDAENMVNSYLGNNTPIYTLFKGTRVHFPKNVLIPLSDIINKKDKWVYDFSMSDLQCNSIDLTPDRSHRAPHSILWMLNNNCSTNCKYCYADRKTTHEPLTTAEALNIIDEAHQLKINYIDVIGGEVFLRKDWHILLKKLIDYNMSPSYISTKFPITDIVAQKLYKTGYHNVIQISLDSVDDEILSKIIGTKSGYAARLQAGVSLLEALGFELQFDTIITSLNYKKEIIHKIYQYVKNIKNLKYWEIRIPTSSLYTPSSFSEIKATKENLLELKNYIHSELIPNATCKIIFNTDAIDEKFRCGKKEDKWFKGGQCGMLEDRIFLLPDGKVSICEQLYWHPNFIIGDLRKQTLTEIWNSPKAKKLFERGKSSFKNESQCPKCVIFEECIKNKRKCLVKTIKAYGLENWDFPDPRCEFAPEFNSNLIYK